MSTTVHQSTKTKNLLLSKGTFSSHILVPFSELHGKLELIYYFNMEKIPYSSDPRVNKFSSINNWEEAIENEKDAETFLFLMNHSLKSHNIHLGVDSQILEVGSGSGVLLDHLKKRGLHVIGVDARPRGETLEGVVAARIEQLPFKDETFDLVLGAAVFDSGVYYQKQEEMVKEIIRVLKPGAVFYTALVNDVDFSKYFQVLERGEGRNPRGLYKKREAQESVI